MNHKRVLVRKVHKISVFRSDQFESWLSDMAAKGLVLKKIDFVFCHFVKTRPRVEEYRVVISKKEITREQVESLEKRGWEKVVKYRDVHIFSGDSYMKKKEIYRSTKEQAQSLKSHLHMLKMQLLIIGVLLPLYILFAGYILSLDGKPFLEVVNTGVSWLLQPVYVLIYEIILLCEFVGTHKFYKQLLEGKTQNHHSPWKKCHYVYSGLLVVTLSLFSLQGVDLGYSISRLTNYRGTLEAYSVKKGNNTLPILRLSTLESEPLYKSLEENNRHHFSDQWIREDKSLFGPVQYRSYEVGQVKGKQFQVSKKEYMPSLKIKYYHLACIPLAKGVLGDLVEELREEGRLLAQHQSWKIVSYDGVDQIYYAQRGDEIYIVARKKRKVLQVVYIGNMKREILFQEISQRM